MLVIRLMRLDNFKICGINSFDIASYCVEVGYGFCGFIFYEKSPRNISLEQAVKMGLLFDELAQADHNYHHKHQHPPDAGHHHIEGHHMAGNHLGCGTKKIAVVVDVSIELLHEINLALKPDIFQLHGDETVDKISQIKSCFPNIKLIKAVNIPDTPHIPKEESGVEDLISAKEFNEIASVQNIQNIINQSVDLIDYFLFDTKMGNKKGGTGQIFNWKILENFHITKPYFLAGGLSEGNIDSAIKVSDASFFDISSSLEIEKGKKDMGRLKSLTKKIITL